MALVKRRIIVDGVRLEGPEAARVVREALRGARQSRKTRRRAVLAAGAFLVLTLGALGAANAWLIPRTWSEPARTWVGIGVGIPAGLVIGWGTVTICLLAARRELREAMHRRGFDLCRSCGYWLKGLPPETDRCPECGAGREEMDEDESAAAG